jgi:uncharacterized protein YbbK (DUF523 family)
MMQHWFANKNLYEYSGFILKSKSPSCGIESAQLVSESGKVINSNELGMFIKLLLDQFSNSLVIDEIGLEDILNRSEFINAINKKNGK